MRRVILLLVCALGLGALVFGLYYQYATSRTHALIHAPEAELRWLRHEFQLSEDQFERIRQLHQEYAPRCERMCRRIEQVNARLDELIGQSGGMSAELNAAINDCAVAQAECRKNMLDHVYAVAGQMSPAEGARYTAMMKKRIIQPGMSSAAIVSHSGH